MQDIFQSRYSPRAFKSDALKQDELESMFEAARWAPSSYNIQPWRFVYTSRESSENFDDLFDCLVEFNQKWCHQVPTLVLGVSKLTSDSGHENSYYKYDTGAAVVSFTLKGLEHGIYCHQMGGFDAEKAKVAANIPEGYVPTVMIAVGYLGNDEDLHPEFKEMENNERTRMDLSDIIFEGKMK